MAVLLILIGLALATALAVAVASASRRDQGMRNVQLHRQRGQARIQQITQDAVQQMLDVVRDHRPE